jgi:hypothetical protein
MEIPLKLLLETQKLLPAAENCIFLVQIVGLGLQLVYIWAPNVVTLLLIRNCEKMFRPSSSYN